MTTTLAADHSMQETTGERAGNRLLIAAGAAAATADQAPPQIRSLIENASEVLLITPVLTSNLHVWTDDYDNARHEADERLARILGQIKTIAPDSHVRGQTGSDVPLTAFDDAVRTFRPDQILIVLRPAEQAAWQEEDLVEQVKQRFHLPTTVVELDPTGDTPPVSTVRSSTRHATNLYRRTSRRALRPIRKAEAEAHHLHEVERAGQAADTPFIAILGLILFLLPIFAIIVGLSFAAYYLVA